MFHAVSLVYRIEHWGDGNEFIIVGLIPHKNE
jgi:hypothetical protein